MQMPGMMAVRRDSLDHLIENEYRYYIIVQSNSAQARWLANAREGDNVGRTLEETAEDAERKVAAKIGGGELVCRRTHRKRRQRKPL